MSKSKNQFFRKITRVGAEFIILSILVERGKLHPYEIQELVQGQLLQKYRNEIENLNKIIKLCEEIISNHHNNTISKNQKDILKFIKNLNSLLFTFFGKALLKKINENKDLLLDLQNLKEGAEKILDYEGSRLNIWDHIPMIYQVLKDLEKRDLIKFSGTQIISGRIRKLYQITTNGRDEALKMISLFGDLTSVIFSKARFFQDNFNHLFQNHLKISLDLVEKLYPDLNLINFLNEIHKSNPKIESDFESAFPLIKNDIFLFSLILEDLLTLENLKLDKTPNKQKDLFKFLLVKRLENYRNKIDDCIKKLK